jgi:hypothetical protein
MLKDVNGDKEIIRCAMSLLLALRQKKLRLNITKRLKVLEAFQLSATT